MVHSRAITIGATKVYIGPVIDQPNMTGLEFGMESEVTGRGKRYAIISVSDALTLASNILLTANEYLKERKASTE